MISRYGTLVLICWTVAFFLMGWATGVPIFYVYAGVCACPLIERAAATMNDIADRLEKLLDVGLATLKRGDAVGAMLVLTQTWEEAENFVRIGACDQINNAKEKHR